MDSSALIVVIIGTLMFFGFAVWMAFHSRRNAASGQTAPQAENGNESKSR